MSFTSALAAIAILAAAAPEAGGGHPIRIGLLEAGPSSGSLAAGVEAAVAEVNARGGIEGAPVAVARMAPARPWRDGASRMAGVTFEEGLLALIGPTEGAAAHVAAQIATRRRVPILVLSGEGSLTRAGDPWVFRGVPEDGEQAAALLRWAFPDARGRRAAVAVPDGREGRERLASVQKACRDLGIEVAEVVRVNDMDVQSPHGRRWSSIERADVLLLWLDPVPALALLDELSQLPSPRRILGSLRLDDRRFLDNAPLGADGLAVPLLRAEAPDGEADAQRALGYDMVFAIVGAAERAAPEPARVREGLADGGTLRGRSGTFSFDGSGNRRGPIPIGVLRDGRLVPAPANDVRPTDSPDIAEVGPA